MHPNYFELFQLPQNFELDVADLERRHRTIITRVHPDQFANKSAAEQRVAVQWASLANEAYDTLKSPLLRAQYLLQLNAPELADEKTYTALPQAFLIQQMQWREALEEGAVDEVRDEVASAHDSTLQELAQACAQQNWNDVAQTLAKSQFIENFIGQLPSIT